MTNFEPKKVSVILPSLNELENLLLLIPDINRALIDFSHEIVVVDDNSQDGTFDTLNKLNNPTVKIITRKSNPGFAFSIREGIEHSEGDVVVIMDSDYNHEPSSLPILVSNLMYFDCVIASRFVYGGSMNTALRLKLSWLFNIGIRLVTRKFITDSLFGYISIKRSTLNLLDFDKIFLGFGDYNIRLMFYLQNLNTPILQIPGILGKRKYGSGNKKFFRTFLHYSAEVLKLVIKEKF